ncbi:hypothetical protein TNCV_751691 [Trichonephila clavipes]|uniref:Uncharacterized protein n=1 Tax=Trichonephila clavipes TaxID=2585209 RepID=A0A8X6WBH8_TRICX|nr:hypothetical protein TNCV_751691 [Trichonephila clavipes]
MVDKSILEFVQSLKNAIDVDFGNENEMDNADHVHKVPTSPEMWNMMKSMCSYLDRHSNDEMNNKMDDIEQFDITKTMQRKVSDYYPNPS